MRVVLTVNGRPWSGEVPVRLTLSDLLRDRLGLTGTQWAASKVSAAPAPCSPTGRRSVPA